MTSKSKLTMLLERFSLNHLSFIVDGCSVHSPYTHPNSKGVGRIYI